jgi:hypothetical protein
MGAESGGSSERGVGIARVELDVGVEDLARLSHFVRAF